jgi:ABC-type Fe3+/spermidine/putrescine transport system ATPase subunit
MPGDVRVRAVRQGNAPEPSDIATIALRPEKLRILREGEQADNQINGQISGQTFLGESLLSRVQVQSGNELLVRHGDANIQTGFGVGAPVVLGWNVDDGVLVTD